MSRSSTKQPASVKLSKARKDTLTKQLDFDRKAMVEAGLHDSLHNMLALIAELFINDEVLEVAGDRYAR